MRFIWFFIPGLLLLFTWSGCKEKETYGQLAFSVEPQAGDQAFVLGQPYPNVQGQDFTLTNFKLYLSDITLIGTDNRETRVCEVALFDFSTGVMRTLEAEGIAASMEVPTGSYQAIRFGVGVPARYNTEAGSPEVSPVDYPEEHPLSERHGMVWSWTSGYIFAQLDGRIDSSDTGNLDHSLTYHTGANALYRTREIEHSFSVAEDQNVPLELILDVPHIFYSETDTLDMVTQNLTHTMPPGSPEYELAAKVAENLADFAFSIK
jgi:hypothetical protein